MIENRSALKEEKRFIIYMISKASVSYGKPLIPQ